MNTPVTMEGVITNLRAIRRAKNLSLSDVEALSKGALKAVVLGSYERGARTLSVRRAIAIAQLYQVPVSQLFGDERPVQIVGPEKVVIDLRAINVGAMEVDHHDHARYQLIARVAQRIVRSRQDWNGEVLSLRSNDLETISLMFDQPISEVLEWLEKERALLKRKTY